ncbi:BMP family ABC transporter substrate-binding protein [Maridesulfovibrio ferrireducens]|uniref:Basic membrane protein A n=1 Tax=Maridesulfovibrio ferrireducens TaxID=246191 RepID=A0A1G9HGV1_9BACT|nr:BMP family ABC transporter substrate-binding protein [Maridesulfovibrio ferrireducens]MBI9110510.1 BMP family ABC transporter substrate-binding protein [Maridesulfovibrio ferrireducens]SDL12117.1 basic membrane protein A [Maridesulfovibrio ferrireducens]
MRKLMIMVIVAAMSVMMATVAFADAKKKVKVGFVYISPVADAGYSYAQDQGRLAIDKLPYVESSFVESVAEGTDSERVVLNFARKGYDVIFGTSFGYMDPMVKVSKKFPNVAFMHCSGFKTTPNMTNYFGRMYQARYLTGMVAGMMSKSNIIGYVAAFPIPEVIRGINAFTLGARAVNPKATVRVVWTKTWYDPALEKDAAISLLDMGADVITQHQDSPGPQEAAQERGKYSIGYNSDMARLAPKSHLTAAVWNWAPLFTNVVEQVRDGVWQGNESLWWGMDQGVVDIAPFGSMVPQNVQDKVNAAKAEIVAGNNAIFVGPLKNQAGKVIIPAGQTLDDPKLLGMSWFVEGVVGNTE